MLIMPMISRLIVKWFHLDVSSGRAVIFSAGNRLFLCEFCLADKIHILLVLSLIQNNIKITCFYIK